jgi:hypothetical protein
VADVERRLTELGRKMPGASAKRRRGMIHQARSPRSRCLLVPHIIRLPAKKAVLVRCQEHRRSPDVDLGKIRGSDA